MTSECKLSVRFYRQLLPGTTIILDSFLSCTCKSLQEDFLPLLHPMSSKSVKVAGNSFSRRVTADRKLKNFEQSYFGWSTSQQIMSFQRMNIKLYQQPARHNNNSSPGQLQPGVAYTDTIHLSSNDLQLKAVVDFKAFNAVYALASVFLLRNEMFTLISRHMIEIRTRL